MLEFIVDSIRMGYASRTMDDLCVHLRRQYPAELVAEARRVVEAEIQRIRVLRDPPGLISKDLNGWYLGPHESDLFWPSVRRHLACTGWNESSLDGLDRESTKIVSLLEHPGLGMFKRKGLVVGYVQSGKTANFTAVIAKAADAGYKLFIVMSGVTNKLRRQTQARFESDLRSLVPERWISLTDEDHDFERRLAGNVDAFLTQYAHQRTVCVVKKIPMRLRLLAEWLEGAREEVLNSCPVLIIDDEADEASVNVAKLQDVRSRANEQICRIVNLLPKVAFVGYTATPFANIFIDPSDPEDLYPRDFIIDLPRKPEYFGAERIFGRADLSPEDSEMDRTGIDVVRRIFSAEALAMRPARGTPVVDLEVLPSLTDAVRWFWLATACRRVRRGKADFHSSMLIHSSQRALVHNAFRGPLEKYRDDVVTRLQLNDVSLIARFAAQWDEETTKVRASDFGYETIPFSALLTDLKEVVAGTKIVVENYLATPDDRLSYGHDPETVIVIGGSILARGLTLEGLTTSHFVRSASAYDALLQMGRWFGYRKGYEDIQRIWMTDELREQFFDMATVEQELRNDIARYEREGLTPMDFAPRIRTHPSLLITSKLKMRHAVRCSVSYDEKRIQTTIFKHKDKAWLERNIQAAFALVKEAAAFAVKSSEIVQGRHVLFGVPVSCIRTFLDRYHVHERHEQFNKNALGSYIESENAAGALLHWNVAIMGQQDDRLGRISFGLGAEANLIRRSRIRNVGGDAFANLKAIMSETDICADMTDLPAEISRSEMFAMRNASAPGTGLMLLYPICATSKADPESYIRADLDAVATVVGVGMVLPKSARVSGAVDYMTADLSAVEAAEIDELPQEVLEEAQ